MLQRLRKNAGFFTMESAIFATILIVIGHTQYSKGKWGKGGSEYKVTCETDKSCWYHAEYLKP